MFTIWKFPIYPQPGDQHIKIPACAELLSVGDQHGTIMLWYVVETNQATVTKSFVVVPTGGELPYQRKDMLFCGTVTHEVKDTGLDLVWHVFEVRT